MSWLGSFGVLPSPNHVLAKLAIFRGAEPSPHSPRATDSAAVFYYYFKPFATPLLLSLSSYSIRTSLVRQLHPPVLLTTSVRHPLQSCLLLSPPFQNGPPTTLLPSCHHVSCLQAEMKISRLLAIETELLFHEVVDPPPSVDLTLSFSFAFGRPLYLRWKSPKSLLFFYVPSLFLFCSSDWWKV